MRGMRMGVALFGWLSPAGAGSHQWRDYRQPHREPSCPLPELPQLETDSPRQETTWEKACPGGGTVDAERLKRPERKLVPVQVRPRVLQVSRRRGGTSGPSRTRADPGG